MTEANKEISKMSETEATFSGAKRVTVRVIDDYVAVVGQGNSAKEALEDLETEVFRQVADCSHNPVGGATVLFDGDAQAWVAYLTFIQYKDEEFDE